MLSVDRVFLRGVGVTQGLRSDATVFDREGVINEADV
jgi:hypothetical protein